MAIIGLLSAVTAWFVAKNKFTKVAATVDGKVNVERQPPFPEEAYKKFVTKGDYDTHCENNRNDFREIFKKIDELKKDIADWRVGVATQLGSINTSINNLGEKLKERI